MVKVKIQSKTEEPKKSWATKSLPRLVVSSAGTLVMATFVDTSHHSFYGFELPTTGTTATQFSVSAFKEIEGSIILSNTD